MPTLLPDQLVAPLLQLREDGIPADVIELLTQGDVGRGIAPGALSRAMEALVAQGPEMHIVFDRLPGPAPAVFVEVEDAHGRGVAIGNWRERPDGLAELVIHMADLSGLASRSPASS